MIKSLQIDEKINLNTTFKILLTENISENWFFIKCHMQRVWVYAKTIVRKKGTGFG